MEYPAEWAAPMTVSGSRRNRFKATVTEQPGLSYAPHPDEMSRPLRGYSLIRAVPAPPPALRCGATRVGTSSSTTMPGFLPAFLPRSESSTGSFGAVAAGK
jgi:hypothetical protein